MTACARTDPHPLGECPAYAAACPPGRHRYRRVPLPDSRAVYADGSSITPTAEVCARCGARKRGSFDLR